MRAAALLTCAAVAFGCPRADSNEARAPDPLFGLGRAPSADELLALDIDVSPDGAGLPVGHGSVADGRALFAAQCAGCHGADGSNARFGRLFGRRPPEGYKLGRPPPGKAWATVGNYYPYATTLFDYIRRSMPVTAPGTLTADQTYALTAWILWRNNIISEEVTLDAASLLLVRMPARDRFVLAPPNRR